ncbi:MAG TPA: PQQ-dependent sugar dehydrogenase [Candidatus Limnocylindrales bacterium]|nr:PQQ-dependent sugar dehydrogenase [Candidatus Limnocylindrales bacterium]
MIFRTMGSRPGCGPFRFTTAVLFLMLCTSTPAPAATVPAGFSDSVVASGLASPTAMEIAPDGRIFVSQQTGALRVIKNGALLATPFLTLSVNSSGERGLLGVVFDPNFASNRFIYVYYTTSTSPIHNRVSRFTASLANPDVAQAGETVLLDLENLSATNHNGGALHFGPDGKLYIAAGENAVGSNSQAMTNLLGKILRINSDGTIPTDNPFYQTATGNNRAIWARGLRNPFTFTFDPASGRMLINDVGQNTWEEIDDGIAGSNYGWPTSEGPVGCTGSGFTCPIYSYDHSQGCAITGGAFYSPSTVSFPSGYNGLYFFADYCGNWIRVIDPDAPPSSNGAPIFASSVSAPVDLRVGSDGSLYYLARGAGAVGRIRYTSSDPPNVTQDPSSQTVTVGATASFSVSASGSPPLLYQWQRNHADITGANAATLNISNVQQSDNGALFRCVVQNDFGSDTSADATLTVTANTAPTATITQPAAGTHYNAGQTILYAGTAADQEDPSIPASSFTWRVDFHHDTHVHPFIQPFSGVTSGSFVIPNTGETAANVWYRIYLTVRDSGNLVHTVFRDVVPNTSTITLASSPTGLQLTLDGQPVTAPSSVLGVVGMLRSIGAVSPQTSGSTTWNFSSWSDSGAATHNVTTPSAATTYTASFSPVAVNGNGLSGAYFRTRDLTGTATTRIDPTVSFDWGKGAPVTGYPTDNFSARWTGQVQPQFTGPTTFYLLADDGVRLWVNNALLIDRWVSPNTAEASGAITLTGGQKYSIRIEYFEKTNRAAIRLSWSSASQPKQVIPQARLYTP